MKVVKMVQLVKEVAIYLFRIPHRIAVYIEFHKLRYFKVL